MTDQPWYLAVQQHLLTLSTADRLSWAAKFVGFPGPEDYPRPGTVAAWTPDDWRRWLFDHGFEQVSDSKHIVFYDHKVVRGLGAAINHQFNDIRAAMNCAADARRVSATLCAQVVTMVLSHLGHAKVCFRDDPDGTRILKSEEFFRECMRRNIGQDSLTEALVHLAERQESETENIDRAIQSWKILTVLDKEFGVSPRAVLAKYGCTGNSADAFLMMCKQRDFVNAGRCVTWQTLEVLRSHLEDQREIEATEKEQRRASRREKADAATALPDASVLEQQAKAHAKRYPATAQWTESRGATRKFYTAGYQEATHLCGDVSKALSAVMRSLSDSIAAAHNIPLPPSPLGLEQEFEDARVKVIESREKIDLLTAENDRLRAELKESDDLLKAADATSPWQSHFERLVADVEKRLGSTDIMEIVKNLGELRQVVDAAKDRIPAHAPASASAPE